MPSRRLLTPLLVGALLAVAAAAPSASAGAQVERRLSLDSNGRVAVAEVARAMLPWLRPRYRRDITITTTAAKRIAGTLGQHTLRTWNIQGRMAGVSFSADGDDLLLIFDTDKLKRRGLLLKSLARRFATMRGTGAASLVPSSGQPPPVTAQQPHSAPTGDGRLDRPGRHARGSLPAIEPGLIRVSDSRVGGPPVVLVHGLDGHVASFAAAATQLGDRGYDVYVLQWSAGQSVPDAAAFLGKELRGLHGKVGEKISLVTTSLGGIIGAWYIEQDPAYSREVGRLIACCPPFQGAPLAAYHPRSALTSMMGALASQGLGPLFVFDGLGDAAADIVPGSPILRTLQKTKRRRGVRYAILAGNKPLLPDQVLLMAEGLVHQGAQNAQGAALDLMKWLGSVAREARAVSGGRGDGVVPLASTELSGVTDREVLSVNHMEFLSTPRPEAGPDAKVPALAEVVRRLPRVR